MIVKEDRRNPYLTSQMNNFELRIQNLESNKQDKILDGVIRNDEKLTSLCESQNLLNEKIDQIQRPHPNNVIKEYPWWMKLFSCF